MEFEEEDRHVVICPYVDRLCDDACLAFIKETDMTHCQRFNIETYDA